MKLQKLALILILALTVVWGVGCSQQTNRDADVPLAVEEISDGELPQDIIDQNTVTADSGGNDLLAKTTLGTTLSSTLVRSVFSDPTGLTLAEDYDGDGIPNDQEITTNPFVADYPKIVTRISAPITMEIRVNLENTSENFSETVEASDMKDTISNSMENNHYDSLNKKTTPCPTKESSTDAGSYSKSDGFADASELSVSGEVKGKIPVIGEGEVSSTVSTKNSHSENHSIATSFETARMSERVEFKDVDYSDNLDKNGVEYKKDTTENITRNYKKACKEKNLESIGPNAGYVRAGLYLKNPSPNMPVKISNVVCTLSFKTQSGDILPVKTFLLRNEDWSEFNKEVYGGEELGPYTIEVDNLNTYEIKKALSNAYIPQINVVSYNITRVNDSNYNPGVDNLKIVEENAKGRTATIKIVGPNMRELHKVAAFDVNSSGDITMGISLKKALFNIYHDQIGPEEVWATDKNGQGLTVTDEHLSWKKTAVRPDASDPNKYIVSRNGSGSLYKGNKWRKFETYMKVYKDEYNRERYIESIKRIDSLNKYSPFCAEDNPGYNDNEYITDSELSKTKYWVILHNGRYYEGDINDPIVPGERYELIYVDLSDFQEHFNTILFDPLKTHENVILNTRWNSLNNQDEFDRSVYLGKIMKDDVIHLEIDLLRYRKLFNQNATDNGFGVGTYISQNNGTAYNNFKYNTEVSATSNYGIPKEFSHEAEGGVNNLTVYLNKSENANYYIISIRDASKPDSTTRYIKVTAADLARLNYVVQINRKTVDRNGVELGLIEGDDQTAVSAGRKYLIKATAYGINYGVPVAVQSSSNKDASAYVKKAVGTPAEFSFMAIGGTNNLQINIANYANTEYYLIKYSGPYNSSYRPNNEEPVENTCIAKAGSNIITVNNPNQTIDEPGVYKVQVFSVNDNSFAANGSYVDNMMAEGINGEQWVNVNYDKYANQKTLLPALYTKLSNMNAVDLEVNFNDGSGWYRIKVSTDDEGAKVIDCRQTSYMEYNQQKFHIYFKAPDSDGMWGGNIFTGMREEADVYIRTAADNKYRDTLWIKPNATTYPAFDQTGKYLYIANNASQFPGGDVLNYWINNPKTDATLIEDFADYNYAPDTADFSGINSGNFVTHAIAKNDLFFAPMENKTYGIKVEITDQLQLADPAQKPSMPKFKAIEGEKSIYVSDIEAQYADSYKVCWKKKEVAGGSENLDTIGSWSTSGWITSNNGGKVEYTITNLQANQYYVVAVVARNDNGESKPIVYNDDPYTTAQELVALMPYSNTAPGAPANLVCQLTNGGKSLLVSNMRVPGEYIYTIYYKRENINAPDIANDLAAMTAVETDPTWEKRQLVSNDLWAPLTYQIDNVLDWSNYRVMVRAVSKSGVKGDVATATFSGTNSINIKTNDNIDIKKYYHLGWCGFKNNNIEPEYIAYSGTTFDRIIYNCPGSYARSDIQILSNVDSIVKQINGSNITIKWSYGIYDLTNGIVISKKPYMKSGIQDTINITYQSTIDLIKEWIFNTGTNDYLQNYFLYQPNNTTYKVIFAGIDVNNCYWYFFSGKVANVYPFVNYSALSMFYNSHLSSNPNENSVRFAFSTESFLANPSSPPANSANIESLKSNDPGKRNFNGVNLSFYNQNKDSFLNIYRYYDGLIYYNFMDVTLKLNVTVENYCGETKTQEIELVVPNLLPSFNN